MKFLAVTIGILFLFASCSKSKDFTTSYLRGKIDGVAFDCNANIRAYKPMPVPGQGGSDPTLIITGNWSLYSLKLNIYGEGSSITAGAYVFQADKNRSATLWYNNIDAYYAGNGSIFSPPQLYGSGRITILEINESYIRGTFEFTSGLDPATMISKTVSEGEFYIKRS